MNTIKNIQKIYEINNFLEQLLEKKEIRNYRITLHIFTQIGVDILTDNIKGKKWYFEQDILKSCEKVVKINEIEYEEYDQKEYDLIFSKKIDLNQRRRLGDVITPKSSPIEKPCPVVTFYSYKGGTGRTTSLAYFASWLAMTQERKVVLIDCDFEAPGLINYFDIIEEKKGIAEYFLEMEYAQLTNQTLDIKKDYAYQISQAYTGKGDIYVIPSGNLGNEVIENYGNRTARMDYLEAIARLDVGNITRITKQFETFFEALRVQLELDENSIILIDSRTGFNDTFAVLSALSDIIVGFFGINKQSQVGIEQFLDTFFALDVKKELQEKDVFLVKSFHNANRQGEKAFKQIIEDYITRNQSKFVDDGNGEVDIESKLFSLKHNTVLENIGTASENENQDEMETESGTEKRNMDFIEMAQEPTDFKGFFKAIFEAISKKKKSNEKDDIQNVISENVVLEELPKTNENSTKIDDFFFEQIKGKIDKSQRRERLLRSLVNHFPKAYADGEIPELTNFFFRDCLKDIFNRAMFLVVGYKGTGKTHIYQSFQNPKITDELCKIHKQESDKYIFVNVIPVKPKKEGEGEEEEKKEKEKFYFNTQNKFSREEIKNVGEDFFFSRFWLAYVWNSIFTNENIQKMGIKISTETQEITNNDTSANWFRKIIANNEIIESLENDLKKLDEVLKQQDKTLILSFDQLDFVVKPEKWSEGIAPLISSWRTNGFSRIYPKIFVRADLYENKLGNITNINHLKSKEISLQWKQEELFSYLFKWIFNTNKEDFFAFSYAFNNYKGETKNKLLRIENEKDAQNQIPLHKENDLKYLVTCFFGDTANRTKSAGRDFGHPYDWFYRNLQDAKKSISLRPFLDLINYAINEDALKHKKLEDFKNFRPNDPILSAFYFTSAEATSSAVEKYYNDIAKEEGNEFLNFFRDYMKQDGDTKFKIFEFKGEELDDFFKHITTLPKYQGNEVLKLSYNELKNVLINNGILWESSYTNHVKKYTRYIVPFLYRNYLQLTNPHKSN